MAEVIFGALLAIISGAIASIIQIKLSGRRLLEEHYAEKRHYALHFTHMHFVHINSMMIQKEITEVYEYINKQQNEMFMYSPYLPDDVFRLWKECRTAVSKSRIEQSKTKTMDVERVGELDSKVESLSEQAIQSIRGYIKP